MKNALTYNDVKNRAERENLHDNTQSNEILDASFGITINHYSFPSLNSLQQVVYHEFKNFRIYGQ